VGLQLSEPEAVAAARPDAIVHEMTALSVAHNGKPNFRHLERFAATTNGLRTEGTDHPLAAAEATASRTSSRRASPPGPKSAMVTGERGGPAALGGG
jgi:hypothetical protein